MTAAKARQVSAWTTGLLVGCIVVLTLFVSPGQGDVLGRLFPFTVPLIGSESRYDTCLGGIDCQDGHALAFMALGASLAVLVLAGRRGLRRFAGGAVVLLILVGFAALDELAQGWMGRQPSFDDWLADVSGAVLGLVLGSELARFLVQDQPER